MPDVNILLLGETGAGKTTFINAIFNYLRYNSLAEAGRNFLQQVPTTFELTTSEYVTQVVSTGSHRNENQGGGQSGTQGPLVHSVIYKSRNVTVIDTPGLGDTRGLEYDERNVTNLVNFLNRLGHVNAICIVLKTSDSRSTAIFNFCIHKALSQLNRDVLSNVVFLFTHGRGNSYRPGDTLQPLQVALANSQTSLRLCRENTFCLDNEAFRYLAARSRGVQFPPDEEQVYEESWDHSAQECKRMLDHILTLPPSPTKIIVSLRDANAAIALLAKPLVEIMVQHQRSVAQIKGYQDDINQHKSSIEHLKTRLKVPIIQYKTTKKTIVDTQSGHKAQAGVSFLSVLFGSAKYKYVNDTKTHSEELVEPYETIIEDAGVRAHLLTESNKLELVEQNLRQLLQMQEEFTSESSVVVEAAATFLAFLRSNTALGVSEDAFQKYIEQILEEELRCNGSSAFTKNLESLLVRYKLKKNNLTQVTSDDVQRAISDLLGLKHAGSIFRRLYNRLLQ